MIAAHQPAAEIGGDGDDELDLAAADQASTSAGLRASATMSK